MTTYYYKIVGLSTNDWSDESAAVETPAPATPYGASVDINGGDVTVNWMDPDVERILYFNIYRADGAGGYAWIGATEDRTSSWLDAGLDPGTYHYKVTAVYSILDGAGTLESAASDPVEAVLT